MSVKDTEKGSELSEPKPAKRRVGRPKKSEQLTKTKGSRKTLGRPKGDASIIEEYKARMLNSPKSVKVLEKIFDAALDDDHKNQAAAWKIVIDRVAPLTYFEKDQRTNGKSAISISITGVGGETTVIGTGPEPLEGEYEEDV
jgi:hypothetical protein